MSGEDIIADELYQGAHGIDLPIGETLIVKAYDIAYEQKSSVATYIINAATNCIVKDEEGHTLTPAEALDKDGNVPETGDRFLDVDDRQNEIIDVSLDPKTKIYTVIASRVFTVCFDLNGGKLADGSTSLFSDVVKNRKLAKPDEDPIKDGSDFVGWYLNDTLYDFDQKVTAEMTLIAGYKKHRETTTYTLTYQLAGGKYEGSTDDIREEHEEGSVVRLHEAPVKEGYVFLYWDAPGMLPGDDYEVKGDHTFKAVYKKNGDEKATYTLTYNLNGGSYNGSYADIVEEHKEGSIIRVHAAPEKEGYTFSHWEGSIYYPGDRYTVEGNHTFKAIFIRNKDKKDDAYRIPVTGID